jgi:hypothetical protein
MTRTPKVLAIMLVIPPLAALIAGYLLGCLGMNARRVADITQGDPLSGLLEEQVSRPTVSHRLLGHGLASLASPMARVADRARRLTSADSAASLNDGPGAAAASSP